jgi:hypothetical protein
MRQKESFLILSLIVSISLMSKLYALDLSTPEKRNVNKTGVVCSV